MCLLANGMIRRETIFEPHEISREALLVVHTQRYLNSLNVSCDVFTLTATACYCQNDEGHCIQVTVWFSWPRFEFHLWQHFLPLLHQHCVVYQ